MGKVEPRNVREYVEAIDRLAGRPPQSPQRIEAIVVALAPMLVLGASLGPWPEQRPAGPHDSIADAP